MATDEPPKEDATMPIKTHDAVERRDDFVLGTPAGPPVAPPPGRRAAEHHENEAEVDAVATWFARIGAGALLLAAGFGYKYAVDRGLITPPLRVAMGFAAGALLLWAGEATRRRDWTAFAQAATGAGIGLFYLSTWAAYERYGLISAPAAFAALTVVVALGVGFAWRHDAEVLAILATLGGFLNPFLVGNVMAPLPVLAYVAILDAGILTTITFRPWRSVGRVALFATWIFAGASALTAGPAAALAYGTVFWALFCLHPLVRAALPRRRTHPEESGFSVVNGYAFWAFAMGVLSGEHTVWQGAVTAGIGAGYLLQWAAIRPRGEAERNLAAALVAMALGFFTLAVPIQFQGHTVAAGWTVEAVVLVGVGRSIGRRSLRIGGALLLGAALTWSVLFAFGLGASYHPLRPLVSGESLTLLLQVAALHVVAALMRPTDRDELDHAIHAAASVAGHVLLLVWAALETGAYWYARLPLPAAESAVQFTLTVTWSAYGVALMAAGIGSRRRRARLAALGILMVTIAKVALVDLWLLSTLDRVIAFGALGVALLACSLLYHRFRRLILEA